MAARTVVIRGVPISVTPVGNISAAYGLNTKTIGETQKLTSDESDEDDLDFSCGTNGAKSRRRTQKQLQKDLITKCQKHDWTKYTEASDGLQKIYPELWMEWALIKNRTQLLQDAINIVGEMLPKLPYERRLFNIIARTFPEHDYQPDEDIFEVCLRIYEAERDRRPKTDIYKLTERYIDFMDYIPMHNEMFADMIRVMKRDLGKRNCIYMHGTSNGGKTTISRLLSCVYDEREIGSIPTQGNEGTFWLQGLVSKQLYHAEELLVTSKNIDTVKILFEGSEDLKTDMKYGSPVTIDKNPIICTSNERIWANASGYHSAIKNRAVIKKFTKEVDPDINLYIEDKKQLQCILILLIGWAKYDPFV